MVDSISLAVHFSHLPIEKSEQASMDGRVLLHRFKSRAYNSKANNAPWQVAVSKPIEEKRNKKKKSSAHAHTQQYCDEIKTKYF